jgi:hypothetical protein
MQNRGQTPLFIAQQLPHHPAQHKRLRNSMTFHNITEQGGLRVRLPRCQDCFPGKVLKSGRPTNWAPGLEIFINIPGFTLEALILNSLKRIFLK